LKCKEIAFLIVLVLLFPVYAKGIASEDHVLPDIEITNPIDGQTVEGSVDVKVKAVGVGLRSPYLTFEGEGAGTRFIMEDCVHSKPAGEEENGGVESMLCSYVWDTSSFEGQKVAISAEVKDDSGYDSDKVAVRVSGHTKSGNGRISCILREW